VKLNRRALLAGLGLSAGLVPLLSPRRSRAADGTNRPKRFIVIGVPNGYTPDFLPVADGPTWKPQEVEFSPLRPLVPYKDRLLILGGVTIENGRATAREVKMNPTAGIGGHAILPMLLTGAKGVPGPSIPDGWRLSSGHASVDQYIAQHSVGAKGRPFPSLVLRPIRLSPGGYGNQPLSYSGKCLDGATHNAPTMRESPTKLFADLFGGGIDTATLDRVRAERRSLLDFTRRQLEGFQRQIGKDDKIRVEQHLEGVRRLETLLEGIPGAGACKPGAPPDAAAWVEQQFNPKLDVVIRAHTEMTVAAMACDLTRVASHNWCSSNNNTIVFNWLVPKLPSLGGTFMGGDNGGSGNTLMNHHSIAHNDGVGRLRREKNCTDEFFMECFALFLERLAETPDFDGRPMLDNTLVLYANLQRTGGGHQVDNLIWMLGGNCDNYFKTGRYLPWASGVEGQSVPTNGILTAIVNATGCPPVGHFGDPQFGGELATLRA
jgi:hypothetical protein